MTNIPAEHILAASQGLRTAREVLTQRVGEYNLARETRLMLAALVFAARYSWSGDRPRGWDKSMSLLVERHADLLKRLGIPEGYNRPSESRRAALPFVDAFIKIQEGELQPVST